MDSNCPKGKGLPRTLVIGGSPWVGPPCCSRTKSMSYSNIWCLCFINTTAISTQELHNNSFLLKIIFPRITMWICWHLTCSKMENAQEISYPGGPPSAWLEDSEISSFRCDSTGSPSYKGTDTRICTIQEHCSGQKHMAHIIQDRKQMECIWLTCHLF